MGNLTPEREYELWAKNQLCRLTLQETNEIRAELDAVRAENAMQRDRLADRDELWALVRTFITSTDGVSIVSALNALRAYVSEKAPAGR